MTVHSIAFCAPESRLTPCGDVDGAGSMPEPGKEHSGHYVHREGDGQCAGGSKSRTCSKYCGRAETSAPEAGASLEGC